MSDRGIWKVFTLLIMLLVTKFLNICEVQFINLFMVCAFCLLLGRSFFSPKSCTYSLFFFFLKWLMSFPSTCKLCDLFAYLFIFLLLHKVGVNIDFFPHSDISSFYWKDHLFTKCFNGNIIDQKIRYVCISFWTPFCFIDLFLIRETALCVYLDLR